MIFEEKSICDIYIYIYIYSDDPVGEALVDSLCLFRYSVYIHIHIYKLAVKTAKRMVNSNT